MTSFLTSIGKKKRSPEQLVQVTKETLQRLINSSSSQLLTEPEEKKLEEERNALLATISKALIDMKNILYGDHDSSTAPSSSTAATANPAAVPLEEDKIRELSLQLQSENVLIQLIQCLALISFESRKDTVLIYTNLMKKNIASFAQYITQHHLSIMQFLIEGYGNAEIAFHCGIMIRESIKYADVLRHILLSNPHDLVWPFIDRFLHLPNFDIASDGFNTFKELFNATISSHTSSSSSSSNNNNTAPGEVSEQHQLIINEFFETHGNEFLSKYEILLRSENYVTRRRSLKLLGELLLDRSHYSLMISYVSSTANLKTIMHLLRNRSPHITFETFHIFKIFVANPNKPSEIASILFNNKVKLIAYLENFQNDRQDPQFVEEKRLLIETLQQLSDPYEHADHRDRSEERGIFSRANSKNVDTTSSVEGAPHLLSELERLSLSLIDSSNHGNDRSVSVDNTSQPPQTKPPSEPQPPLDHRQQS